MSAGAREVYLIDEPMAAAIGAGIDIREPKGNVIVDIGGGTTEIGVISLGGLVLCQSIRVAGDKIDRAIMDYVKRKYNLLIGERIAEDIKINIGTAMPLAQELKMIINGRDQVEGLLTSLELSSEDAREAMRDPLREILEAVRDVLEKMPPDLAGDIVNNGVILTGGGALIRQLDKYLSETIKIPVYVADEPLLCVAKGTGRALEEIDQLHELFDNE
jgi:rod shape-determining protein MreB